MSRIIQELSAVRIKFYVLCLLGVLHLFMTTFAIVPGYVSIDEAIYHLMLKNFSATGGLEIWTGYREHPSPELTHDFLRIHAGRIVSQYPYLFPVLALPFYKLAGYYGLFLTNSLAFVLMVLLCFGIAQRLFDNTNLSLNACLIFVLATFSWEYSQSAWPAATSQLFETAAFYAVISSCYAETKRSRIAHAAAAGLIGGFAPGVHMTTAIVLPCLVIPFLFARPWRPLEAVIVMVSTIPGLAILAWTNLIKFGVFSPFSYGTGLNRYTPSVPIYLVAAACGVMLIAWICTRISTSENPGTRTRVSLAVVAVGIAALALIPQMRDLVLRILSGVWMMLVDLRIRDMRIMEAALQRTPTGALVYIGGLKKSLLQSLPYLTVLVIPIAALVRGKEESGRLAMLFLVPLAVTAFFSNLLDHAGLSLNLRYFLPVLPFTSILAAYAIEDLLRDGDIRSKPQVWLLPMILTAVSYFLLTNIWSESLRELEVVLLSVPLWPALLLLALLTVREFVRDRRVPLIGSMVWAVLTAALVWSFLVSFFYDYPLHRRQRASNYNFCEKIMTLIPSDSVFFTAPYIDPFLRLIEKDRVRIAMPGNDRFKDFPRLVREYLDTGIRVFAVFPERYWVGLKAGPLREYAVRPIYAFPGSFVAEITREDDRTDSAR